MTRSLATVIVVALLVLSVIVSLYSAWYFTSFTWKSSTDVRPCEMSFFHLTHFPINLTLTRPVTDTDSDTGASSGAVPRLIRYTETQSANDSLINGPPILFLHGNSGNYHQARSLFSRVNTIQTDSGRLIDRHDYYSVDYNEEKIALNGKLIMAQIHYLDQILRFLRKRYSRKRFQLTVVAHSMGGTVMQGLLKYHSEHRDFINGIYYIGAPLTRPVITIDRDMQRLYKDTRNHSTSASGSATWSVSISGGINDYFVAPSLAIDPTNANHTNYVSQSVPHVQTSIEHQCLAWCRQLMETLAYSIINRKYRDQYFENSVKLALAPIVNSSDSYSISDSDSQSGVHVSLSQWTKQNQFAFPLHANRSILLLFHAKPQSVRLCPANIASDSGTGSSRECVDVSSELRETNPVYPRSYYPTAVLTRKKVYQSIGSDHSLLVIDSHRLASLVGGVLVIEPLLTKEILTSLKIENPHQPKLKEQSDTNQLFVVLSVYHYRSLSLLPSPSAVLSLAPGVYVWRDHVPANVDRYYDLSLSNRHHSPTTVMLHQSSLPVMASDAIDQPCALDDFTMTEVNISTVLRYYACHYDRTATIVLVLSPPLLSLNGTVNQYDLSLSFSYYSYLRTLFSQMPALPYYVLAGALFTVGAQYCYASVSPAQQFVYPWQLPTVILSALPTIAVPMLVVVLLLLVPSALLSNNSAVELLLASLVLFLFSIALVTIVTILLWILLLSLSYCCYYAAKLLPRTLANLLKLVYAVIVAVGLMQLIAVNLAVYTDRTAAYSALLRSFVSVAVSERVVALASLAHVLGYCSLSFHLAGRHERAYQLQSVLLALIASTAVVLPTLTNGPLHYQTSVPPLILHHSHPTFPLLVLLHLVLVVACYRSPHSIPMFQSLVYGYYGLMCFFQSHSGVLTEWLYQVVAILVLCLIPHAGVNLWIAAAEWWRSLTHRPSAREKRD